MAALNIGQNDMYDFGERIAWGDDRDKYDNFYEWKDYKFLHPKSEVNPKMIIALYRYQAYEVNPKSWTD